MYLRAADYDPAIQDANLQQIISTNSMIRLTAELRAKEEVESYLKGKYNTDAEFIDTNPFDATFGYLATYRAELNFAAYVPTTSYLAADKTCVINSGLAYIILNNTTGTFVTNDWTLLGTQYEIWYLKTPYPEFNYYGLWAIGDNVIWKNKVYTCKQATGQITHQISVNAINQKSIPATNVFPDDPTSGVTAWGVGVPYSVTGAIPNATYSAWAAGSYSKGDRVLYSDDIVYESLINSNTIEPGTDIISWQPVKWTLGDNRSQRIVELMVDISLMKLHQRIAPRNIPDLRQKNYDSAIEWLKDANIGNITPSLILKQPLQGNRISFGGNTKLENIY